VHIVVKSHTQEKVGRLCLDIDDKRKIVRVYAASPLEQAPNRAEIKAISKYLSVIRPDICRDEIMTGWAIESSMRVAV